jgi:hypothetical protein
MRGSHEGQPGGGRGPVHAFEVHALRIDQHGQETSAGRRQDRARARVVRLLEQHPVAGIEQHARHEIDPLLRAAYDHHLLRPAHDGARTDEVGRDRGAQLGEPGGVTVVELAHRGAPSPPRQQAPPEAVREVVEDGRP